MLLIVIGVELIIATAKAIVKAIVKAVVVIALEQGDRQSLAFSIDGGRASNEPEATLFGKQTGMSPGAPKVDVFEEVNSLFKDYQSKELAPDKQRTGKKEGDEALTSSLVTPLNSGNLGDASIGTAEHADVVDMAVQTDISLPQRVDAYWHCSPSSMRIVDRSRSDNGR